jgi:hypothetical protein
MSYFSYKNIDYERYMLVHLRKNAKSIIMLWYKYLFDAKSNLNLFQLLLLTNDLFNMSKDKVEEKYNFES